MLAIVCDASNELLPEFDQQPEPQSKQSYLGLWKSVERARKSSLVQIHDFHHFHFQQATKQSTMTNTMAAADDKISSNNNNNSGGGITPLQFTFAAIILGASAGLTLYTKRTSTILHQMERASKNATEWKGPQKFGPKTKMEWDKLRNRWEKDDL